jgi:hypothetical protein
MSLEEMREHVPTYKEGRSTQGLLLQKFIALHCQFPEFI